MRLSLIDIPALIDFGIIDRPWGISIRLFEYSIDDDDYDVYERRDEVFIHRFAEVYRLLCDNPICVEVPSIEFVMALYPDYSSIDLVCPEALFEVHMVRDVIWAEDNSRYCVY